MTTKGKRPLRSLTPSDKINAIQRIHDGESKASVARDIGVPESTLRGWCKNEDKLRFMSRQTDKITADSLAEKLGTSAAILVGPPEKRQKLDGSSVPFIYSNKIKYDDMMYKRSPLNGIDYASSKTLSEITFNGLSTDYVAFSSAVKNNKSFGTDVSRQTDPAIAAISPLTSLSQLSGLSGLAQSPLAISFNELTSNLNILAQLNPGLAAMSCLNELGATANPLRNVKTKPQLQLESPQSDCGDRQQGLSVKNWAKQKSPSSTSEESCYGLNLRLNEDNNNKNKIKCPSPSLAPSLSILSDDPLIYWLKSQQAMLGLNNIYPSPLAPPMGASSPPLRSSTPHQSAKLHVTTPLNVSASITPSTAPSLDGKNSAWLNWCKALGASLNSLAPTTASAVLHGPPIKQQHQPSSIATISTDIETTALTSNISTQNSQLENILFTQLTKSIDSCSTESSTILNNTHSTHMENVDTSNKPEDLSARTVKNNLTATSPSPTVPAQNSTPSPNTGESLVPTPIHSPNEQLIAEVPNSPLYNEEAEDCGTNMSDCKDVLDNLLYKINNNPSVISLSKATTPTSVEGADDDGCISESNISYGSDNNQNSSDENVNNNNHSNKTDEEERFKLSALKKEDEDYEAINHGEQFLKWLENCSNPRITASHLMQLRFLISALKSNCDPNDESSLHNLKSSSTERAPENIVDTLEDNSLINKGRRRK